MSFEDVRVSENSIKNNGVFDTHYFSWKINNIGGSF